MSLVEQVNLGEVRRDDPISVLCIVLSSNRLISSVALGCSSFIIQAVSYFQHFLKLAASAFPTDYANICSGLNHRLMSNDNSLLGPILIYVPDC